MNDERLLQTKKLFALLDWEVYSLLFSLILSAYLFYLVFLKDVSPERHKNVKRHFKNILQHFAVLTILFVLFLSLETLDLNATFVQKALPYLALGTLIWGMVVFVKVTRLSILQYLFLGSMRHGVPVLIVNIVSLSLSVGFVLWTANHIFNVELAPLVATSAAFSIILGLALQDTLGNLFAGISFQLDKSFEIGDWLEVQQGAVKIQGQVKEISWRATLLIGWAEERVTIPNRVLASSMISNFSLESQPILRSHKFQIDYSHPREVVRQCLLESAKKVGSVKSWPEPIVFISETSGSALTYKLCFYIDNFGSQNTTLDHVINESLTRLDALNIKVATDKLNILHEAKL